VDNPFRRYYFSDALKSDYNAYLKFNQDIGDHFKVFADMQNRYIDYSSMGDDNDGTAIIIDTSYNFINPKLGLSYLPDDNNVYYLSLSRAQREPVRSDFLDAVGTEVPTPEELWDVEAGWRHDAKRWRWAVNMYYMLYNNQLVVTGAVNDVGAAVRTNVDKSYRVGIELDGSVALNAKWSWSGNLALSRNKIEAFTEIIPDYGNGTLVSNDFENTDIAFSPSVNAASIWQYRPLRGMELQLLTKYVGKQYLDNTSNEDKTLDPYLVNDLVLNYRPVIQGITNIEFKLIINNILDARYASNGYTYSYIFGELIEENFYYPQAGRHLLLGASFDF